MFGAALPSRRCEAAINQTIIFAEELAIPSAECKFAELIANHQQDLLRLACRLVGNVEDAKDLAQWAFVRLWLHRGNLAAEGDAFFYLRRILVNLCIDHLRRRQADKNDSAFTDDQLIEPGPNPLQELETQEWQTLLVRCIAQLKPKQKATIILRDLEGYSVAETAALLSCTANNVLCNLHLARKNVKQKMQQWLSPHELLS